MHLTAEQERTISQTVPDFRTPEVHFRGVSPITVSQEEYDRVYELLLSGFSRVDSMPQEEWKIKTTDAVLRRLSSFYEKAEEMGKVKLYEIIDHRLGLGNDTVSLQIGDTIVSDGTVSAGIWRNSPLPQEPITDENGNVINKQFIARKDALGIANLISNEIAGVDMKGSFGRIKKMSDVRPAKDPRFEAVFASADMSKWEGFELVAFYFPPVPLINQFFIYTGFLRKKPDVSATQ